MSRIQFWAIRDTGSMITIVKVEGPEESMGG